MSLPNSIYRYIFLKKYVKVSLKTNQNVNIFKLAEFSTELAEFWGLIGRGPLRALATVRVSLPLPLCVNGLENARDKASSGLVNVNNAVQ